MLTTLTLTLTLLAAQDPFLPDVPGWERIGDEAYQIVGWRAVNAGDVDGDGRDDLLVMAPGVAAVTGLHGKGRVELFYGSASGWSATADWTVWGDPSSVAPWNSIDWDAAGIGDVNADGYADIAVSSRHGTQDNGAVHVFYGGPSGPNGGQDGRLVDADWSAIGPGGQQGYGFGASVLGPGDVDGDGVDDLLVGWRAYNGGESNEGRVLLFPGEQMVGLPGGPLASPADATWSAESDRDWSYFGDRLHSLGDVDNDGNVEFAVHGAGGPQDNSLLGRIWAFTDVTGGHGLDANGAAFQTFDGGGLHIGSDLAAADFDLDGYSDLVLGFPWVWIGPLKEPLQLWRGGPSGYSLDSWAVESTPWFDGAGVALAAGDLDVDGRPDLAVVSEGNPTPFVRVFRGSANGLTAIETHPAWEYELSTPGGGATVRAEIVGDPEGDGTNALAVAEPGATVGSLNGAGRVGVFTRIGDAPDPCPFAHPNWDMEELTWLGERHEVLLADVIPDANDCDDAIVCKSTPPHIRVYAGSPTGLATTPTVSLDLPDPEAWRGVVPVAAGDVDHDGADDVLILRNGRRYLASDGIGLHAHAAAYLLMGDAQSPSIGWSAAQQTADPIHFAWAGTILDLDGDDYDDVVLGAPGHERDPWPQFQDPYDIPGAIYVYPGGSQGVNAGVLGNELNAASSASDLDSSGDFGHRLRNAGHLDPGPTEELLVAAPYTRNAVGERVGAMYLWLGSAAGVAGPADWHVDGTEPGGLLGILMDAGVDVTGDGIPDLVTLRREGAWPVGLEVWPGGTTGFAMVPFPVDAVGAFQLLDDFTGDGLGDIAVARQQATVRFPMDGRVAVIHGGPDLSLGYLRWRAAGEKARTFLSLPLAPARGDVNGDGKSDLLATSSWYHVLESEERARVVCYYGRKRPLLELSETTVIGGQTVGVGHYGGQPYAAVQFYPKTYQGQPITGLQRIFAGGRVGGDCCWHVDWTVPGVLPVGTYQVWTVQPGSPTWRSQLVTLVVQ